jgi:hypothetical protein
MSVRPALAIAAFCLIGTAAASSQQVPEIDALLPAVFVGQAYPSGNVYLRPFVGDGTNAGSWPARVALAPVGAAELRVRGARFDRMLRSQSNDTVIRSIYIPGEEAVGDGHDSCGLGQIKPRVESYRVMSPDFFETLVDHCEPNDGIAVYRTEPTTYSVMVLALADPIAVAARAAIGFASRPVSDSERSQMEKERRSPSTECATAPAFLDQAVVLFQAQLVNPVATLRLSSYIDPGCSGHLTRIYLLDLLRDDQPVRTLRLVQYKGAL